MNQHSWLYSDSFLKRAFAIWGHYMVANLIIGACLFAVMMVLAIAFGLNLAATMPQQNGQLQVDFDPAVD